MNKLEKKDCGESVRVHSMLRLSIMLIALRTPQIMINFLKYLETSLLRHTQEMQYLLGSASADFTF